MFDVLLPMGNILNERQCRELAGLKDDQILDVWQRAVDRYGPNPTGEQIKAIVQGQKSAAAIFAVATSHPGSEYRRGNKAVGLDLSAMQLKHALDTWAL